MKKIACRMEKEISGPLGTSIISKTLELSINRNHRLDLDQVLDASHDILQQVHQAQSVGWRSRLRSALTLVPRRLRACLRSRRRDSRMSRCAQRLSHRAHRRQRSTLEVPVSHAAATTPGSNDVRAPAPITHVRCHSGYGKIASGNHRYDLSEYPIDGFAATGLCKRCFLTTDCRAHVLAGY